LNPDTDLSPDPEAKRFAGKLVLNSILKVLESCECFLFLIKFEKNFVDPQGIFIRRVAESATLVFRYFGIIKP